MHSVYGKPSKKGLRLDNARAFLATAWGASAEEFLAHAADADLVQELLTFLWDDVLKPQAKREAGLFAGQIQIGREAMNIWRQVSAVPDLRERCVARVLEAHQQYEALRQKREAILTAFAHVCRRTLEHIFLRPLLLSLDLFEDFCNTPCEVRGSPEISTKFDAIFTESEAGETFRRSILESCGVGRFHVLSERVRDVVAEMEWTSEADGVFAFCDALGAIGPEESEAHRRPFPNFLSLVYPAYLRAITTDDNYFLSDLELLLLARCARTNVVIFKYDTTDSELEYHRSCIVDESQPCILTAVRTRRGQATVRSHFERLQQVTRPGDTAFRQPQVTLGAGASSSTETDPPSAHGACHGSSPLPQKPLQQNSMLGHQGGQDSTGGAVKSTAEPAKSSASIPSIWEQFFGDWKPDDVPTALRDTTVTGSLYARGAGATAADEPAEPSAALAKAAQSADSKVPSIKEQLDELLNMDGLPERELPEAPTASPVGRPQTSSCVFDPIAELLNDPAYDQVSRGSDSVDGDLPSLSDSSQNDDDSDAEDIFGVSARPESELSVEYRLCFLYRWEQAVVETCEHLREDVLLPLHPDPGETGATWTQVDKALVLPSWHCSFLGCAACCQRQTDSNHEAGLWQHIWNASTHRPLLTKVIRNHKLQETHMAIEEVAFTLYNQALAEKERQSCPVLGVATDRRSLAHLREVFYEENVATLICFVCGCKHLKIDGYDKFGRPVRKGTIDYRPDMHRTLKRMFEDDDYEKSWRYNFSYKHFKNRFGEAVSSDPGLQDGVYEWRRNVRRGSATEEILCCPEDVKRGTSCRHDDQTVCSRCHIPICNECWHKGTTNQKIPRAMTNDNFLGYAHRFLIENKVTWLEATIAAPVFTGLVTYYIEGAPKTSYNLMDSTLGKADHSWGVRGNLFSFLLPWEKVLAQLFEKVEDGDLTDWPLSPDTVRNVVRVKFTRASESLVQHFRDLYVRSAVVKRLAYIYIERKIADLADRPGVLAIHTLENCVNVAESLKSHAAKRIEKYYPASRHGGDAGALLPGLRELLEKQNQDTVSGPDSCFDQKQATGHDVSRSAQDLFEGVRPSLVLDEGETQDTFAPEVVAEHALDNILDMTVRMSTMFEDQFVSKYLPRILPWALNYDCGGADYPKLFANWEDVLQNQEQMLTEGIQQRWRKLADEAVLLPGEYAQMLATRSEMQIGGDWMVVPSARNLHWRYAVLHSAFMVCKQKVAPGETLSHNLTELIEATKKIWTRISSNTVTINQQKRNINGNLGMLFSADNITSTEKIILRSYLNTTASIAGCQAIRKKMGHCCFGFRVVQGEVIFVTVSPNRRHSSMVLKLSRARRNDTSLLGDDNVSRERRKHCGPDGPRIFTKWSVAEDPEAEKTSVDIPLPDIFTRQAWNAQDPLASCHHYLFFMYVMLPALFGVRMCLMCPHCNADNTDPNLECPVESPCSDYMGCNSNRGS